MGILKKLTEQLTVCQAWVGYTVTNIQLAMESELFMYINQLRVLSL